MLNEVALIGNLGADPEIKKSRSGNPWGHLRVATTHRTKEDDEWVDQVEWHRVVVFGKVAQSCGKYLEKGRQVFVKGRLQTRKWEDSDGNTRYITEIIALEVKFLGSAKSRDDGDDDGEKRSTRRRRKTSKRKRDEPEDHGYDEVDDETPF